METAMIRRVVLCLALLSGPAAAQEPACTFYKVDTSFLNVSKDVGGHIYTDVLYDGEIACVSRQDKAHGEDWGFISYKLEGSSGRKAVDGWSSLRAMKQLSPAEAAAVGSRRAPAAAAKPAPPSAAPVAPVPGSATVRPEDVLRFNQPVPFGPFPVNGKTIKELAEGIPLFSPIEGLEESVWKKECSSCHKWNQARLCDQGKTYAKDAKFILRHPHPYGGTYKIALMRWAKSGCE
jgi:hypothetical protein